MKLRFEPDLDFQLEESIIRPISICLSISWFRSPLVSISTTIMSAESFFHSLEFLLCVALLILLFTTVWQWLCTDITRQQHFELRDQLFLLAMNGRMSFSDSVYRELREMLNNRIRMAHRLRLSDFIAWLIVHKGIVPKDHTLFDKIETVIDSDLRSELRGIYDQANLYLFIHILVRSPVYIPIVLLFGLIILVAFIGGGAVACTRWFLNLARIVDDDAGIKRILQNS